MNGNPFGVNTLARLDLPALARWNADRETREKHLDSLYFWGDR
jgi:hypothetical protein